MVNFLPDKLHLWRPLYHQGKATALSTLSATHGTILSEVAKTLETGTGIEKVLATTGLEPASPGRPWQESNPRLWTSRWPAPSLGPHSQELYHWATRPAIKLGQISRIARPVCNPCRSHVFKLWNLKTKLMSTRTTSAMASLLTQPAGHRKLLSLCPDLRKTLLECHQARCCVRHNCQSLCCRYTSAPSQNPMCHLKYQKTKWWWGEVVRWWGVCPTPAEPLQNPAPSTSLLPLLIGLCDADWLLINLY